jgi:ABC-type uncharacterized transport system involved in gliding motility auxiliary subunit
MSVDNKDLAAMTAKERANRMWRSVKGKGAILFAAGGLSLVAAGIWYTIGQTFDTWTQWLLICGLLLIGTYVLLRPEEVKRALGGRTVRYGSSALVLSLAVLGIVVLLNILSDRTYKRFDVTEIKRHSLSEQSIAIVEGIDQEIEIVGFYPNGRNQDEFERWLDEYYAHTDKLKYESVDPILEPGKAEQYQWSGYGGGLIVKRADQSQPVYTADEQNITSALLKVSRDTQKVVYFLSGHKERSPGDYDQAGYGQIGQLLQENNYAVKTLNLAISDTIPADTALIVVAGPETALLAEEKGTLTNYLVQGGKALILANPALPDSGIEENINDVLSPWQVRLDNSLVVDARSALSGDPTTPAIDRYLYSQITKDLPMIALPHARPIVLEDEGDGITFRPLAESSVQSWAKTDLEKLVQDGDLAYDEGIDRPGPLTLVASVESAPNTRMVLIGDVDLAANHWLSQIPNGQYLILNAVNWLAEEEALITIAPKTSTPRSIYLSGIQQGTVCFGTLVFIPGTILFVGFVVWWRRR